MGIFDVFKKKESELANPIEGFWKWFNSNSNRIHRIDDNNPDTIINEVFSELSKIREGLSMEFSACNEGGIRDFIITPEGDRENFELVETIVNQAPQITNWNIIAFRQRVHDTFSLKIEGLVLDVAQMFFYPLNDESALDIIVYGENFKKQEEKTLFHYGLIMMDNLIGEYDCVMTVRHYDFKDLNEVDNKDDLIKLSDLPAYIDEFKKTKLN